MTTNRAVAVAADTIETRINAHYAGLSAKLRAAADFVAEHPVEVATRSLRSVAQASGVSPATFSRLARALGFADYEALREAGRTAVGQRIAPFSERARALRRSGAGQSATDPFELQARACASNITYLEQTLSGATLDAAVSSLHAAGRVLLIASMGSSGIVEYFGYQAQWFLSNWVVAGRHGVSTAASLARMSRGDAVLVLVKAPYARRSIAALAQAREIGLSTVVITDAHSSPALAYADHAFVVPTQSPNFFSSYVATLVLLESMMTMLLHRAGPEAETRIRETEDTVARLGENWPS